MNNRGENSALQIRDLGIIEYSKCLELQKRLHEQVRLGDIANTVLLLEHEPVITLGARKDKNELIASAQMLSSDGIELVQIRRGGGATAHNPGQLVMYPIINLKTLNLGVNEYVRQLEEIGIELLGSVGVKADRKAGYPGLWVGEQKIASIGVRVQKWVTYHGIAINICNDLSIFDKIVPCGLAGVKMTSAEKITENKKPAKPQIDEAKKTITSLVQKYWQ
jgi:lipoyl(octanoyl) transferase